MQVDNVQRSAIRPLGMLFRLKRAASPDGRGLIRFAKSLLAIHLSRRCWARTRQAVYLSRLGGPLAEHGDRCFPVNGREVVEDHVNPFTSREVQHRPRW